MAERIIKLSDDALRQNEIERLKRKFNNINNDTTSSNHHNSLTSSMISQSITQTTTSFEGEKPSEENKKSDKETKNSQKNNFNKNNKNFSSLKIVEQISKLNARKNSTNPTKISYISTKNDIGKVSNLNLPQNKKQEITTKNISKFHIRSQSNLVKNRSETPQSKNPKANAGILTQSHEKLETKITFKPNSNLNNSNPFLSNKIDTSNKNSIRNKNVSASSKNFNERSISETVSKHQRNKMDSDLENSRINRMNTEESQTTQIIQMNNINTEKILSTLFIKIFDLDKASNNKISQSNSSIFAGGTISPVMDYKKRESFYLSEIENNLEVEKEHLISNENIPPENNYSIVNKNYMERVKKITGFADLKKTYTKDTEVIGAQSELDYNILNYKISEQSVLNTSILNTVERDNIFYNNPTWLLSNRLINDEKNCLNRQVTVTTPHYKFLERVREDSIKAVCFKTKFFLLLDEDAMYNLLCFIFDKYKIITKINKLIERKICFTLNTKFEKAINDFRLNYGGVLELQEFYFNHSEIKKLNPDSKVNAESNQYNIITNIN